MFKIFINKYFKIYKLNINIKILYKITFVIPLILCFSIISLYLVWGSLVIRKNSESLSYNECFKGLILYSVVLK